MKCLSIEHFTGNKKLKLQRICLQKFKYAKNTLPEAISELFISNTAYHTYNTRNKQNLRAKVSKIAYMCIRTLVLLEYRSGMKFKRTLMSPCHLAHSKGQHKHIICRTTLSILLHNLSYLSLHLITQLYYF